MKKVYKHGDKVWCPRNQPCIVLCDTHGHKKTKGVSPFRYILMDKYGHLFRYRDGRTVVPRGEKVTVRLPNGVEKRVKKSLVLAIQSGSVTEDK